MFLTRGQGVGGSNPSTPTIQPLVFPKFLIPMIATIPAREHCASA
jgi:hypothetical protein